jgi:hypothetical protein
VDRDALHDGKRGEKDRRGFGKRFGTEANIYIYNLK